MDGENNNLPLASEMYADLKESNRFLRKLLVAAFAVILVLIAALCGTHIYHIHQWSQFETVVVDSEQGPANYVQGDNAGGIYNGEGFSSQKENGTGEGSQNQADQLPTGWTRSPASWSRLCSDLVRQTTPRLTERA